MKSDYDLDVFNLIYETARNGVFEIWYQGEDTSEIYIPYMMNDALECYVILRNCVLVGNQIDELKSETKIQIHKENDRYALIAKQANDNTFTIFFDSAELKKNYYRFDTICHFWEKGQEQWAQLVYIVGTMYDKYEFLGDESCNENEMELLHLIEYAPFRYHAPAKALFEELYETTGKGILTMIKLSFNARDYSFFLLNIFYLIFKLDFVAGWLSGKLKKACRYNLYDYIYRKCVTAASAYPERTQDIVRMRNDVNALMLKHNLIGTYPDYSGRNVNIRVVEEHPFTIMDWEDVKLKTTFMVTESEDGKYINSKFNYGFFEHKHKKVKGYFCTPQEFFSKYNK